MGYGGLRMLVEPLQAVAASGDLSHSQPALMAKNLYALSALLRDCSRCLEEFEGSMGGGRLLCQLLAMMPPDGVDQLWLPTKRKVPLPPPTPSPLLLPSDTFPPLPSLALPSRLFPSPHTPRHSPVA